MNDSMAVRAASWNSCSAIAGRMLRSRPTMAPTNALTTTSSANCPTFSRRPSRTAGLAGCAVLMLVRPSGAPPLLPHASDGRPTASFVPAYRVPMTSMYSANTRVVPSVAPLFRVQSAVRSSCSAFLPASSSDAYARLVGP